MDNAVITALVQRRSVRAYKPEQITDDELKTVLEAGTWAPTGMGRQDPWIVAVQNPELLKKLSRMNAAFLGVDSDPFYGAPTYVLVFGSDPAVWKNSVPDGSLVLGNMMNAAHAIGLGSCWINREMEMFSLPEGKALMKDLGVPEELMGIGALALGYADGEPREAKPRKEGYCRVIR
jgi:nitroreductase